MHGKKKKVEITVLWEVWEWKFNWNLTNRICLFQVPGGWFQWPDVGRSVCAEDTTSGICPSLHKPVWYQPSELGEQSVKQGISLPVVFVHIIIMYF